MSAQLIQHTDHIDLTREVRGLKRMLAKLLQRLQQPVGGSDFTLSEWRAKRNIPKATYYKMRKNGRAPRTIECNGVIRITAEADREWEAKYSSVEQRDDQFDLFKSEIAC